MYEDALNAYRNFDWLANNSNIPIPLQDKVLLTDIGAGLATLNVHDDEQSENLKLLRAVQVHQQIATSSFDTISHYSTLLATIRDFCDFFNFGDQKVDALVTGSL